MFLISTNYHSSPKTRPKYHHDQETEYPPLCIYFITHPPRGNGSVGQFTVKKLTALWLNTWPSPGPCGLGPAEGITLEIVGNSALGTETSQKEDLCFNKISRLVAWTSFEMCPFRFTPKLYTSNGKKEDLSMEAGRSGALTTVCLGPEWRVARMVPALPQRTWVQCLTPHMPPPVSVGIAECRARNQHCQVWLQKQIQEKKSVTVGPLTHLDKRMHLCKGK